MKRTLITIGLCLATVLILSATPPIPRHPPAPSITAAKAIEVAEKFAGPDPNSVRYCNSVTLVEGGMTPAPSGSARHWLVTFQDAGGNRAELRRVYVNMEGVTSDAIPPSTSDATNPPLSKEAQAVLDGLNLKAADSVWQSAIEWIERPETRSPNTKDSGEATAFLADSKKRLQNLGVRVVWNATAKRYEAVAEAKDDQLAAKAEVVVRAKLLSTDGDADKYARFRVRVLEVFKNTPGAKLADELLVAAYSGKPGVPDGESTLYLERYNQQSDTGIWKLVGGEASSGVSHSTALAAVQAAKSQPHIVDLGRVEMVDGSPSTFNLGAGRVCTITPTIGFNAVNSYDLVLLAGTEEISAPRHTAVVGQPVHISVGQTDVTFVPDVKSKR